VARFGSALLLAVFRFRFFFGSASGATVSRTRLAIC
jgi:hypothetical protein